MAEEITQNTFFGVHPLPDVSRFHTATTTHWIFLQTSSLPSSAESIEEKSVDPESEVEDKDTALQIHLILHELQEPYKEVFQLRVFGELSFSQIGLIFGKTENWARVTYHRARIKIQERKEKNESA